MYVPSRSNPQSICNTGTIGPSLSVGARAYLRLLLKLPIGCRA
ncbi:MAG: hypothetical protein V7631_4010 [Massilia sp.]|jgi:hypothetical protein